MSMDEVDRQNIEQLAAEGMGAHIDAVYTPPDGGVPVPGVYVIVEDLTDELSGEVTQGGAVLHLLRSQVGTPVQGATLAAGGTTWRINRRRSTTDPSMVAVEAARS